VRTLHREISPFICCHFFKINNESETIVPAPRERTVMGRGKGLDRAGNTLAEYERIEAHLRRAESAGLDLEECPWYREGIEALYDLAKPPVMRDDIDQMASVQSAMEFGLDEAGLAHTYDGMALVPDKHRLYDLQWRVNDHINRLQR
jgi:hypothetical protein